MAIPDDPQAQEIAALYHASIYKIKTTPNPVNPLQCIVCNGMHRFDKCEVLQNTDFLRGHYIRFCQQLRREMQSRASTFGDALVPPTSTSINFVDGADAIAEEAHHSESDDEDNRPDFQTGRR